MRLMLESTQALFRTRSMGKERRMADGQVLEGGVIVGVEPGSVAWRAGLRPGDILEAINGHRLRDLIDVHYHSAEERLKLSARRNGVLFTRHVRRSYGEDLGLTFASLTFDGPIRRCTNNCDICFVKQNAPGMRRSLYVKDDDYRYSFLSGSFVTLTNLTDDDWKRLEEQRLSPLYVSVHATEPALRRTFLRRPDAPDIRDQLRQLGRLGVEVHTQVVVVPGLNDGAALDQTIENLAALYERPVLSLSLVPLGLTRFHRGSCRPNTPAEAQKLLAQARHYGSRFRRELGSRFVFPSDEWYLMLGYEVPPAPAYEDFPQVENGVGMTRLLLDEWAALRSRLPDLPRQQVTLVCGTLIGPVMRRIWGEWSRLTRMHVEVVPVHSAFWGEMVTVSGLLTAQDVLAALEARDLGQAVLLPRAMFTGSYGAGEAPPDVTLDDVSLAELGQTLGRPTLPAGTLQEALDALSHPGQG
jgi:putative radical SAM enzyme (TIGR03279 family)